MITAITFIPVLAALAILLLPGGGRLSKPIALIGSLASSLLAIFVIVGFNFQEGLQYAEKYQWIPSIGVDYYVGIDGLNALLILLVAILSPIIVLAS